MTPFSRLFIALAGLAGACGVAAAAYASHAGGALMDTASTFLMLHAPAFLALGLAGEAPGRGLRWSGLALAAGLILFCGDLAIRELAGARLMPMAAPAGGSLLILGWAGVAVSGLLRR